MSHPTPDISMARPDYLMIAQARSKVTGAMLAASILLMAAGEALTQTDLPAVSNGRSPAQQIVPQQDATVSPAPLREENPGLFNEIGRMFEKLPALKSPQAAIEDLNARARDAARDASDSLSRLTMPSS